MTMRKRLTLWYAALLSIIIILFGAITFFVVRFTLLRQIDDTLLESDARIRDQMRLLQVPTFGEPRVEIQLPELDVFRASGVYVQAWQIVNGQPEFRENSANLAPLGPVPLDADALGSQEGEFSNVTIEGVDLRILTKPIFFSDQLVGNIQLAADLATVNGATDLLLAVMIIACAVAILGAGVLSLWFSRRALRPIEDITRAAATIAGTNDLSTRLKWHGPHDELGRLIAVFNQMMDRIEHLFNVQRRFVADVSHELRTPLTAIQGNLELIKRYGMDEAALEAIDNEAERMTRLVNDLLMLARTDYGGVDVDLYPLDLDTVVMEAFNEGKSLTKDRNLKVELGHFEPVRINGNADWIKQLLLNLINNAVKFTPEGGKITVGLEHIDDSALLWVKDTGIGIAEEDLQRVFDRFYQTEPSRAHTNGGFGLGLSISKWIVEIHDGTIRATSEPGEGTTFIVSLPVYTPHRQRTGYADFNQPTRPHIPIIQRDNGPPGSDSEERHTRHLRIIDRTLSQDSDN